MSNQPSQTNVTTGQVRLSYVHLFTPYANQPGQEPKFSATILLPKSDIATKQRIDMAINAAIQVGVSSKWNGVRPPQMKIPIWDGDGVRQNGEPFQQECKGHWVFTASSKQQQAIVDMNLNPIINQSEVYSGMYARVNINFFPFSSNGNRGIGCGLGPVQKIGDGEPLGGQVTAEAAFGDAPGGYGAPGFPQTQAYPSPGPQSTPLAGYPQQAPYGAPSAQPGYAQQPYGQPGYPQQAYGQAPYAPAAASSFGQQPGQQPGQQLPIDPITGRPVTGGIMGI